MKRVYILNYVNENKQVCNLGFADSLDNALILAERQSVLDANIGDKVFIKSYPMNMLIEEDEAGIDQ